MPRVDRAGAVRRAPAPPLWARAIVLLLVISLMVVYSYAGCQQIRNLRQKGNPEDRIEAVESIRAYVERVEQALRSIDGNQTHDSDG